MMEAEGLQVDGDNLALPGLFFVGKPSTLLFTLILCYKFIPIKYIFRTPFLTYTIRNLKFYAPHTFH